MEDPRIKLRNDDDYYGDYGKQWFSASHIKTLIKNPRLYMKERPDSKALIEGRYFHTQLLEPEKIDSILIADTSSRNTKIYKSFIEDNDVDIALLPSEAENIDKMVDAVRSNSVVSDMLYSTDNAYEMPEVGEIFGKPFKGKADVLTPLNVFDVKSTADIARFKWAAIDFGYDIQAFIYEELFGKPMTFIAVDKKTFKINMYKCSEEFVNSGKMKTLEALNVYDRFFSPDSIEDIKDHYEEIYL